jgi:hypothetical protein
MRVLIAISVAVALSGCAGLREWANGQQKQDYERAVAQLTSQQRVQLSREQQRLNLEQMRDGVAMMESAQFVPMSPAYQPQLTQPTVIGAPSVACTSTALSDGFVNSTCH